MDKQFVFKFQILSLGKSTQQFLESTQYINRPFIQVDDVRKKWGDEYVVINSPSGDFDKKQRTYLGNISLDKKMKKFLKLFKEIDFPIDSPDYYVINVTTKGSKIDKSSDFVKCDEESFSCILSSAYDDNDGIVDNEMIVICQHGDGIVINGEMWLFDKNLKQFLPA